MQLYLEHLGDDHETRKEWHPFRVHGKREAVDTDTQYQVKLEQHTAANYIINAIIVSKQASWGNERNWSNMRNGLIQLISYQNTEVKAVTKNQKGEACSGITQGCKQLAF